MPNFYTIGHSNHSLPEFIALLQENQIQCLADVRKLAGSRAQPQFNQDTLSHALVEHGITYRYLPLLGGLRSKTPAANPGTNAYWQNASFHRYADYTQTANFARGLQELLQLGTQQRCAIMCAEAVWWRCHRRLISDYLIGRGYTVWHIMGAHRLDKAQISAGARVQADGRIEYPANTD